MSSEYGVSFPALSGAIDQAQQQANQIKTTLTNMDSEVRKTLSTWTGDAQDRYTATFTRAMAEAEQLPVSLNAAHQVLDQIMGIYTGVERTVADAF